LIIKTESETLALNRTDDLQLLTDDLQPPILTNGELDPDDLQPLILAEREFERAAGGQGCVSGTG
jgi:hypothetical protein